MNGGVAFGLDIAVPVVGEDILLKSYKLSPLDQEELRERRHILSEIISVEDSMKGLSLLNQRHCGCSVAASLLGSSRRGMTANLPLYFLSLACVWEMQWRRGMESVVVRDMLLWGDYMATIVPDRLSAEWEKRRVAFLSYYAHSQLWLLKRTGRYQKPVEKPREEKRKEVAREVPAFPLVALAAASVVPVTGNMGCSSDPADPMADNTLIQGVVGTTACVIEGNCVSSNDQAGASDFCQIAINGYEKPSAYASVCYLETYEFDYLSVQEFLPAENDYTQHLVYDCNWGSGETPASVYNLVLPQRSFVVFRGNSSNSKFRMCFSSEPFSEGIGVCPSASPTSVSGAPTTSGPTMSPTKSPTVALGTSPSGAPSSFPTRSPVSGSPTSESPSVAPSLRPSVAPSTQMPTGTPTAGPSASSPTTPREGPFEDYGIHLERKIAFWPRMNCSGEGKQLTTEGPACTPLNESSMKAICSGNGSWVVGVWPSDNCTGRVTWGELRNEGECVELLEDDTSLSVDCSFEVVNRSLAPTSVTSSIEGSSARLDVLYVALVPVAAVVFLLGVYLMWRYRSRWRSERGLGSVEL